MRKIEKIFALVKVQQVIASAWEEVHMYILAIGEITGRDT
jgi:hypothetical protein